MCISRLLLHGVLISNCAFVFLQVKGFTFEVENAKCSAAEALTKLLSVRKKMISGAIVYRITIQGNEKDNESIHKDLTWKIWFEKNRIRSERMDSKDIRITCLGCHWKDKLLYVSKSVDPPDSPLVLVVYDEDQRKKDLLMTPDPSLFGLLCVSFIDYARYSPNDFFGEALSHKAICTSTELNGVPCDKIEWRIENRTRRIFLSRDHSRVERAECILNYPEKVVIDSVDFDYSNGTASSPILKNYPDSWLHKRIQNGRIRWTEKGTVEWTSINSNLTNDIFSLHTMEYVEPGSEIVWASSSKFPCESDRMIWDGEKIVCASTLDEIKFDNSKGFRHRLALILINIGIVVFVLALLMQKRFRRPPS